jgi:hypothetical protein
MSAVVIEDAGWQAIMDDPQLQRARRMLSFHEIRLIVNHARNSQGKGLVEIIDGLTDELERLRGEVTHTPIGDEM